MTDVSPEHERTHSVTADSEGVECDKPKKRHKRHLVRRTGQILHWFLRFLLLLLLLDIWLEWHGLPDRLSRYICSKISNPQHQLEWDGLRIGLLRGVILHGARGKLLTVAGPAEYSVRTLAVRLDWQLLWKGYVMPASLQLLGGAVYLFDDQGHRSLPFTEMNVACTMDGQGVMRLKGDGVCQGLTVSLEATIADSHNGLKALMSGEKHDVQVNAELQKKLADINREVHGILPPGGRSRLRLEVEGVWGQFETCQLRGYVNTSDISYKGQIINVFTSEVLGTPEELSLTGLNLVLGAYDVINGQVKLYTKTMEVEGHLTGQLSLEKMMQVYQTAVGKAVTISRDIPQLVANLQIDLKRSKLTVDDLDVHLQGGVPMVSHPQFGAASVDFDAHLAKGKVVLESGEIYLRGHGWENAQFTGELELESGDLKGDLSARLNLSDRLNDAAVMSSKVLDIVSNSCSLEAHVSGNIKDISKIELNGEVLQEDLRLLGELCNEKRVPFKIKDGLFSIEKLTILSRGDALLLEGNLNLDLRQALEHKDYQIVLNHLLVNTPPEEKNEQKRVLDCNVSVQWDNDNSKMAMKIAGTAYVDRLYQGYLRRWDIDPSRLLMKIRSLDGEPLSFHFEMPQTSLREKDWQVRGGLSFGRVFLSQKEFKHVRCDDVVFTSNECSFNGLNCCTVDNDEACFDLGVKYRPVELSFSNATIHGDPRLVGEFFSNLELHSIYNRIFRGVKWSEEHRPEVQMPCLKYRLNGQWTVTCDGIYLHAQDVTYKGFKADELNLIVGLDLPRRVSVAPISIAKDDWRVTGSVDVDLLGGHECRFQINRTVFGVDLRALADGLFPELSQKYSSLEISPDCEVECTGNVLLGDVTSLTLKGSLAASTLKWGTQTLENVNLQWGYDSGVVNWHVTEAVCFGGKLLTTGRYNLNDDAGDVLVRFENVAFNELAKKIRIKEDKTNESVYPGLVNGECHLVLLQGWAGRDLHVEGYANVSLTKGKLWDVPVLSSLGRILESTAFGTVTSGLGAISEMTAEIAFKGKTVTVQKFRTDGTIIALNGEGSYDGETNGLHFLVNGIPVQKVKLLSLLLSPLAGAFQAELSGTLEKHSWGLRTVLDKLF